MLAMPLPLMAFVMLAGHITCFIGVKAVSLTNSCCARVARARLQRLRLA